MKKQIITIEKVVQIVDTWLWKNREWLDTSIDFVIGVSRGGLIPAVWIATHLNKPLTVVYINKQDEVFIDRKDWIKNKRVLIVDDTIRSGKTIKKVDGLIFPIVKSTYHFFIMPDPNNEISFPWDLYDK